MVPSCRIFAAAELTVVVLLCATAIAHAQEQPERIQLRGAVFERGTFAPVPGALVGVPGLDATTKTDSLGNFLLDLPPGPGYRLSVEQLGYVSTGTVVHASDFHLPILILIAPDPVLLGGLEGAVDRLRGRRLSSKSSVRTIDSERLARWGGRDMLSVLRTRIPSLRRCASDPSQYCVRSARRTVPVSVCVDEFLASGGVARLAAYSPRALHLIEVYRGRNGTSIRAYTRGFVEQLTEKPKGLRPLSVRCSGLHDGAGS